MHNSVPTLFLIRIRLLPVLAINMNSADINMSMEEYKHISLRDAIDIKLLSNI